MNDARAQHEYTVGLRDAEATTGPGGMLRQVIFF